MAHVTETSEFLWARQHKQTLHFKSIKSGQGFFFSFYHTNTFSPSSIHRLFNSYWPRPLWSSVAVLTQALRRGDNSAAAGPKFMPADDRLPNSKNSLPQVVTAFFHEEPEAGRKNIPYTQQQRRLRQRWGRTDNGRPRLR